jgi:arginase family enzyme
VSATGPAPGSGRLTSGSPPSCCGYNPAQDVEPFGAQQVADAGDIACNPFDIAEALTQIQAGALSLLERAGKLVTLVTDHDLVFQVIPAAEFDELRPAGVAERIAERTGGRPVYLSVDVDVLDPSIAPGTGTPEAGGRGTDVPRASCHLADDEQAEPGRRGRRRGRPGLRPCRDHRYRCRARGLRGTERAGAAQGSGHIGRLTIRFGAIFVACRR